MYKNVLIWIILMLQFGKMDLNVQRGAIQNVLVYKTLNIRIWYEFVL